MKELLRVPLAVYQENTAAGNADDDNADRDGADAEDASPSAM